MHFRAITSAESRGMVDARARQGEGINSSEGLCRRYSTKITCVNAIIALNKHTVINISSKIRCDWVQYVRYRKTGRADFSSARHGNVVNKFCLCIFDQRKFCFHTSFTLSERFNLWHTDNNNIHGSHVQCWHRGPRTRIRKTGVNRAFARESLR